MKKELSIEEKNQKLLEVTELLNVISQPTRLGILCALENQELYVNEIMERMPTVSQPMISQHLSVLKLNKIVHDKKDGKFVRYSISNKKVVLLIQSLREIFC